MRPSGIAIRRPCHSSLDLAFLWVRGLTIEITRKWGHLLVYPLPTVHSIVLWAADQVRDADIVAIGQEVELRLATSGHLVHFWRHPLILELNVLFPTRLNRFSRQLESADQWQAIRRCFSQESMRKLSDPEPMLVSEATTFCRSLFSPNVWISLNIISQILGVRPWPTRTGSIFKAPVQYTSTCVDA